MFGGGWIYSTEIRSTSCFSVEHAGLCVCVLGSQASKDNGILEVELNKQAMPFETQSTLTGKSGAKPSNSRTIGEPARNVRAERTHEGLEARLGNPSVPHDQLLSRRMQGKREVISTLKVGTMGTYLLHHYWASCLALCARRREVLIDSLMIGCRGSSRAVDGSQEMRYQVGQRR